MKIQTVKTEEDILKCWKALHKLRKHLEEDRFPALIKEMD